MWLGFFDFMEDLLEEERVLMDLMEFDRVSCVWKFLMMMKDKWILFSKIYYIRLFFGILDDFRDWVGKYLDYFWVVMG